MLTTTTKISSVATLETCTNATFPASGNLTSVENLMRNDADFRGEDMRPCMGVDPAFLACRPVHFIFPRTAQMLGEGRLVSDVFLLSQER